MSDKIYAVTIFIVWASATIGAILTATPQIYIASFAATVVISILKGNHP